MKKLITIMKCEKCGVIGFFVLANVNFCYSCGKPLNERFNLGQGFIK